MMDEQMPAPMNAPLLAEAFPKAMRQQAIAVGETLAAILDETYHTRRFSVRVGGESVFLPERLHFGTIGSEPLGGDAGLAARCLCTRSTDGFERQRAARDVVANLRPWSAPFIVALIGEYVSEILSDIERSMSPARLEILAAFAEENPEYWHLTQQRVTSYWNAYYRRTMPQSEYVGFKLVAQISAAHSVAVLQ